MTSRVNPGELAAVPTAAGPIAVANVDGMLHAIDDTCTHRQCSLAEGDLDWTALTCICHDSQFDVTTGAVRRGPAQLSIRSYPVRVEGYNRQVEV